MTAISIDASGNRAGSITSTDTLQPGKAHIVVEFMPDAVEQKPGLVNSRRSTPGNGKLFVNGKPAGEARILGLGVPYFETLDVGSDLGSPVSPDYASPFRFTGKIETIRVGLK